MVTRPPYLVIAALLLGMGPAQAAWKHYKFQNLVLLSIFPQIQTTKGEWKGAVARNAPATGSPLSSMR
jgi:hypothetical protein